MIGDVGQDQWRRSTSSARRSPAGSTSAGTRTRDAPYRGVGAECRVPGARVPARRLACSITGGVVVRDPALTDLGVGTSTATSAPARSLRGARPPLATDDGDTGLDVPLLVSFGEDAGGCVYAVSIAGTAPASRRRRSRHPCPAPDLPPETTIASATATAGTATSRSPRPRPGRASSASSTPAPWTACSSPARFTAAPGQHTFAVRATDPAEPSIRRRRRPWSPPSRVKSG